MSRRSTIMDTNSFSGADAQALPPRLRTLVERRENVLSPSYRLFYKQPVEVVRGRGARVWDGDGREYLDLYNNVPSVGHAHPAVVEAVAHQMAQINTHTRYLHENVVRYAERLLATLPGFDGKALFVCTGSEANDLAIRMARTFTGQRGFLVTAEAYHGNTDLVSGFSPALGSGQVLDPAVEIVAAPDAYRHHVDGDLGAWYADQVRAAIDRLAARGYGLAGFIADALFSSDGVLPGTRGFLRPAIEVVHRAGGLFIADEVQPGFGRTGETFWGHQRHGVVADLLTLGKPMGNGVPVAAVIARDDVLEHFSDQVPYFNTFGGNPVSIAAAAAVLDVIEREGLQEHSRVVGAELLDGLRTLMTDDGVGDVRGAGLYVGFELVIPGSDRVPDRDRALALLEALRERGVLTSVAGPHGNVLKVRPPLPITSAEVARAVDVFGAALHDVSLVDIEP